MSEKKRTGYAKDTKVTAISLTVIVIQSVIIALGLLLRWDWIVWEFGAMLIIPALIMFYYGVRAVVHAGKMMDEERNVSDEQQLKAD